MRAPSSEENIFWTAIIVDAMQTKLPLIDFTTN